MKHLFVPYELAVKLKEKGFNETTLTYYKEDGSFQNNIVCTTEVTFWNLPNCKEISAPLYQQVVDWFRDKNGLHISADWLPNIKKYAPTFVPMKLTPKDFKNYKQFYLERSKYSLKDYYTNRYDTLNKAIDEALKLI